MHDIERELIKATGYKAQRKFTNRQDYLGSILNATLKLSDEDFMELTDDAADWTNAAVAAQNGKDDELPDFDEVAPPDEAEPDEDTSEEPGIELDHDPETGEVTEEADADDDAPAEPVVSAAPKTKPVKATKPPKAAPTGKRPAPPQFGGDAVLDKWGCIEGSKNSRALAMFEKGATAKEVKEELDGTYYNILGKAKENGHKLEKEGSLIKLTHKDDLGKKSGPAAKPTPAKKKK